MVLANAHRFIDFGEFLLPVEYTSEHQTSSESRCFILSSPL